MKYIVTGATGRLGRMFVPRLRAQGHNVVVFGRNVAQLHYLFPDVDAYSYDDLDKQMADCDRVLHLAVINSNAVAASGKDFKTVNVNLAVQVAKSAARYHHVTFFNFSTVQILQGNVATLYTQTKKEGDDALNKIKGLNLVTLYLPYVVTEEWAGTLSFLNRFPEPLAKTLFRPATALKPTVQADHLCEAIMAEEAPSTGAIISEGQQKNWIYRSFKFVVDLSFAVAVLGLFWWLLILVWAAIKIDSPGPGIFVQKRIGKNGRVFTCYKFRTMRMGTLEASTHIISAHSVTKIGSFLRRTKVDELPQIINIIKRQMSLIGPRPGLPVQEELFEARQKCGVFDVLPGISGLAQVNDVDMSTPEKLAHWDARYIALQSIVLDIKIAVKTVLGGGQGDLVKDAPIN